jgi:hypothetical protein
MCLSGVSADCLYGFERFNLQNTSGDGDARRRSSPDHLGRLEEERRRDREAQRLGRLQVDDWLAVAGRSLAPTQNQPERFK